MGMTGEQAYVLAKKLIEAGGGGGGTVDAYTKTQTDNLLIQKVDKEVGKGLFSGSYNDLTDAPTIPTKTSELQNDSRYMTEQAVSDEVNELNSNLSQLEFGENSGTKNIVCVKNQTYTSSHNPSENSRIPINLPSGTYTISYYTDKNTAFYLYDSEGTLIVGKNPQSGVRPSKTFTITSNAKYIDFWISEAGTITDIQIEEGVRSTPYKPYIPSVKMLADEVSAQKNDLGGLTLSASGTTLSITDGTHTWTLEANS